MKLKTYDSYHFKVGGKLLAAMITTLSLVTPFTNAFLLPLAFLIAKQKEIAVRFV